MGEPATDETCALDNIAPVLYSFARLTPAASHTYEDTLVFQAISD